ncbi:acyl-[ACP]--phospholipid O-acyltransferase [Novispirillum sp. DQ9]|uniref:acyl-[ACP]--phospholipid O-acyltransferase n=1 Tax=Novispirillum sp. DQ9 TaxID=3398612 RepID=UPI003C7D4692
MSLLSLFSARRFLPLFVTQFLGALNDNLFKNAALIYILFALADQSGMDGGLLMPVGAGLFVLPFFLFSATAGQMADRFDKARMTRWVKAAEVGIAVAAGAALLTDTVAGMMATLFLLGAQSAFFGPLKYSLLPEALHKDELVGGNALFEAGTFLAILIGTIAGGVLVMLDAGPQIVAFALVAIAGLGFASALMIPSTGISAPQAPVSFNVLRETGRIIGAVRSDRPLLLSIMGISWFWLIGAIFLAEFPAFAKDVIGGSPALVVLFMTIFSVGIGIGSIACQRLLQGEISVKFVPLASIGIALFTIDLALASSAFTPTEGALLTVGQFLSTVAGWRAVADLTLLAICGGLYIVPLYAYMQDRASEEHRASVIAANNVLNAAFMVAGSLAVTALLAIGFSIPDVFLVVAGACVVAAVYICSILPQELFKSVAAWAFRRLFKVEVTGLEKLKRIDGPVVIVANHVSWLDGPLLNAFLPGRIAFAINTFVFKTWWGGLSRYFADMVAIDPTNPMSTKTLIRAVESGQHLVIFPEGRLTTTGSLMKIYDGPAVIADKAGATLVPVKIDGVQFSTLSRLQGKLPLRRFPKVTIAVQDPVNLELPEGVKGRARRKVAAERLYHVMSDMMFQTRLGDHTLFDAFLNARQAYGGKRGVVQDIETMRAAVSYDRILLGSFVLGRKIADHTAQGDYVGVLLPNMVGAVVTFFALQATGRVPAMLNFSTGADTMISACKTARIKTVLTSRKFIEKAKLDAAVARLSAVVDVVYLEDIKASISLADRLYGLAAQRLPKAFAAKVSPDAPAVVLFTSGSEGAPKGVVLSHRNLTSNMAQLAARIDFAPTDTVFNALPVFHSFGLTGGTLLPILSGIKTFMYPSPLHYRIVPELCYDVNATIMFGTDTFLSGYGKHANPYDFYSVRYVFAGAEKVKDSTRHMFVEKFGLRILEGYGATETAPVIAVNTPMHYRSGTVGRLLPGIEFHLEPVPGVEDGQRLSVKGPNVMLGYLKADRPGELQPPADGWYDTGDIVAIDDDGFVRIVGRAKRFVKVAGEMVSLGAVETVAAEVWPGRQHAAVGIPDARKGEQVVLVTDQPGAERSALLAHARAVGVAELMVPKDVLVVDKVPLLGTGKVDYPAVSKLVEQTLLEAAAP